MLGVSMSGLLREFWTQAHTVDRKCVIGLKSSLTPEPVFLARRLPQPFKTSPDVVNAQEKQHRGMEAALGRQQCIVGGSDRKNLEGLVSGWPGEYRGRSQDSGPVGGVS